MSPPSPAAVGRHASRRIATYAWVLPGTVLAGLVVLASLPWAPEPACGGPPPVRARPRRVLRGRTRRRGPHRDRVPRGRQPSAVGAPDLGRGGAGDGRRPPRGAGSRAAAARPLMRTAPHVRPRYTAPDGVGPCSSLGPAPAPPGPLQLRRGPLRRAAQNHAGAHRGPCPPAQRSRSASEGVGLRRRACGSLDAGGDQVSERACAARSAGSPGSSAHRPAERPSRGAARRSAAAGLRRPTAGRRAAAPARRSRSARRRAVARLTAGPAGRWIGPAARARSAGPRRRRRGAGSCPTRSRRAGCGS